MNHMVSLAHHEVGLSPSIMVYQWSDGIFYLSYNGRDLLSAGTGPDFLIWLGKTLYFLMRVYP